MDPLKPLKTVKIPSLNAPGGQKATKSPAERPARCRRIGTLQLPGYTDTRTHNSLTESRRLSNPRCRLVQRLSIPLHPNHQHHRGKQRDLPELKNDLLHSVPLQHDPSDNP